MLIGGETPQLAVAGLTTPDVELRPMRLDREDGEIWTLTAAGSALRVEQAGATTATTKGDQGLELLPRQRAVTVEASNASLISEASAAQGSRSKAVTRQRLFAS